MIASIAIGAILHSAHFDHQPTSDAMRLHDNTPGLYVLADHWTAGVVRNSLGRWSGFAGVIEKIGPLDLTLGASTGYKRKTVHGRAACPYTADRLAVQYYGDTCWAEVGSTRAVLRPLVAISYAIPVKVLDINPRLSLMPKCVTLSVEKQVDIIK